MLRSLYSSFFFSSRRRHTSWTGDWSSDVCSSDLDCLLLPAGGRACECGAPPASAELCGGLHHGRGRRYSHRPATGRSEERRVGKECGGRGWEDECDISGRV